MHLCTNVTQSVKQPFLNKFNIISKKNKETQLKNVKYNILVLISDIFILKKKECVQCKICTVQDIS